MAGKRDVKRGVVAIVATPQKSVVGGRKRRRRRQPSYTRDRQEGLEVELRADGCLRQGRRQADFPLVNEQERQQT